VFQSEKGLSADGERLARGGLNREKMLNKIRPTRMMVAPYRCKNRTQG
jgi:hypothetical protein